MAQNQITGKVIAISDRQTVNSKDASKQSIVKRQLFLDCTRYDPYTGERGYENTPLLEFSKKALDKLEALQLKKGDIVTVTFDVQGTQYKDQSGKMQVFTSIRPYDIEKRQLQNNQQQPQAPAPTQQPQQAQTQAPIPGDGNDLPF